MRELERLPHHAVDHEPVLGGIDVRRAGVMPLEDEAVRRDDAVAGPAAASCSSRRSSAGSSSTSVRRRTTCASNFDGMP